MILGSVRLLTLLAAGALSFGAQGEVQSRSAAGFVIVHEVALGASPERAYAAITGELGDWWNLDHTYSGVADNLSLEARAGGCFCEVLPEGGSVEHMRVLFARPGKLLRLHGGLGPLQSMGAAGPMDFALEPTEGGGSMLRFRYSVGGFSPDGLAGIADAVDGVLAEQLLRLQRYLEDDA